METMFDALNPHQFQNFTNINVEAIRKKYIRYAVVAGITGLIVGGLLVYCYYEDL
jgi:hypothetical protein